MFTLSQLRAAQERIYQEMLPTPQYAWPLLCKRLGCEVWIKHENHTPTGAFKIRGGITFIDWLRTTHSEVKGIITATRGNHGQAQARAAIKAGLKATIVVPFGNSLEKNAAMRGFGAEVIEHGEDFVAAHEEAMVRATQFGLFPVPTFHRELVLGVATYGVELFEAVSDLDTVYVPIGNGSGIAGTIAARDALGLKTKIVGVVSTEADAVKRGVEAGVLTPTASANTFVDGVAVRAPSQEGFDFYAARVERIVAISDEATAEAMRILWQDTHNLAESAGAIAFAALMAEAKAMRGKKVGVILTGGNIDTDKVAVVLNGVTPQS
jgi:threonine dehydratase